MVLVELYIARFLYNYLSRSSTVILQFFPILSVEKDHRVPERMKLFRILRKLQRQQNCFYYLPLLLSATTVTMTVCTITRLNSKVI